MEEKILGELADYYRILNSKISGSSRMVSIEVNGKIFGGFPAAAIALYCASIGSEVVPETQDISIIHHWLSFCVSEFFHCSSLQDLEQCLKYINQELVNRPYLCGFAETVADTVMYFAVRPIITNWTYYQKEQYINISRWYRAMQVKMLPPESTSAVTFSRTLLYDDMVHMKVS